MESAVKNVIEKARKNNSQKKFSTILFKLLSRSNTSTIIIFGHRYQRTKYFLTNDGTVKFGDLGIASVLEHTFQQFKPQLDSLSS
jgi:hypothetical protein